MEQVGKEFYSNCLIQALKHKLHNKDVKITVIHPKYRKTFSPHFLWSDGTNDYDFGVDYKLKWYQVICYKGRIRKRPLGWNEKYKDNLIKRYNKSKKES